MKGWSPETGPGTETYATVSIDFPMLVVVDDYHAFDEKLRELKNLGIRGIRIREIGCDYDYYGVIYMHKVPKASEVLRLLRKEHPYWSVDECTHFIKYGALPE